MKESIGQRGVQKVLSNGYVVLKSHNKRKSARESALFVHALSHLITAHHIMTASVSRTQFMTPSCGRKTRSRPRSIERDLDRASSMREGDGEKERGRETHALQALPPRNVCSMCHLERCSWAWMTAGEETPESRRAAPKRAPLVASARRFGAGWVAMIALIRILVVDVVAAVVVVDDFASLASTAYFRSGGGSLSFPFPKRSYWPAG